MTVYTPGTKLSYANGTECCTVLTDGNALITRVWGDEWWEQMKLADWLILADGDEEEDYIPLSSYDEYADMPALIPIQHATGPVSPTWSPGTHLLWTNGAETWRAAVVEKDCILQLKSVTDGEEDCFFIKMKYGKVARHLKQTSFDSENHWLHSLPPHGRIYSY
jgi:hypothetical protein